MTPSCSEAARAFAGIAAARRGSRTLIIEQFGALGGSATTGLVLPLMSLHIKNYDGHCPLSAELVERLRAVGGTEEDANSFDPVMVQITLEDMAVTAIFCITPRSWMPCSKIVQ